MTRPYYITTPIYYVNDKPTIGHCYTTLVADVAARFQRLARGQRPDTPEPDRQVFFLTGTDEHADKVVTAARQRGLTPQEWADTNAAEFVEAFRLLNSSHDDFIRTSEKRHTDKVEAYIARLKDSGDIVLGDYAGWYDEGQEEYVPENKAKELGYVSPVTGRDLVKRVEKNYFFRLSAYADRLKKHIEDNPGCIEPSARRNEVLGRIRDGLQDVPISRRVEDRDADAWGVLMPGDDEHRVYVWIDALFNYLSTVDTPDRRRLWPAAVHVIGKDILWFHAVIWPCLLMALGEELPKKLYVHSWWIREGRKMSKSLNNFIDLGLIQAYMDRYSRDAFRWFLTTEGPLGAYDADFAHSRFVETYNADLANGIGNGLSRVGNMVAKYFDGKLPDPKGVTENASYHWPRIVRDDVKEAIYRADRFDLGGAVRQGAEIARRVDSYINETRPFSLAKEIGADDDPESKEKRDQLGAILYHCAEALRVATLVLSPAMPEKMAAAWRAWNCEPAPGATLLELAEWGGPHSLKPGASIAKGDPLFMRADPAEPEPQAG